MVRRYASGMNRRGFFSRLAGLFAGAAAAKALPGAPKVTETQRLATPADLPQKPGHYVIEVDRQPRRYLQVVKVGEQTAWVDGDSPLELECRVRAVLAAMRKAPRGRDA